MSVDNKTLFELLKDEDFNDLTLIEKIVQRLVKSGDRDSFKLLLGMLQFCFLSNGEPYRIRVLTIILDNIGKFDLEEITSLCSDSLVGNYLALILITEKEPIINEKTAGIYLNLLPQLDHLEEVCSFGYPWMHEQVLLQLKDSIDNYNAKEIKQLTHIIKFLFQIDLITKSRSTVESFYHLLHASNNPEDNLKANIISSLLQKDLKLFSMLLEKFGRPTFVNENDIVTNYFEIWKKLEKLGLPVYFNANSIKLNGVLFNDNFYFLKYLRSNGLYAILFPYEQIPINEVSKIFDPFTMKDYTPNESFGHVKVESIFSFTKIEEIQGLLIKDTDVNLIKSLDEDTIDDSLRKILEDPNRSNHSPVEVTDVFTQYVQVNNSNDLRWAGIISKGRSFPKVTHKQLTHQVVNACFSPVDIIILVYVNEIQHEALSNFIKLCRFHKKQYCILDNSTLARLFKAYKIM